MPEPISEELQRYADWHKAAHGWSPLEPLTCFRCKEPIPLIEVYRCYDCRMPMHRQCLIHHCAEGRTPPPQAQMDDVVKLQHIGRAARRFADAADEFLPEYPEAVGEHLEHLVIATDLLGD